MKCRVSFIYEQQNPIVHPGHNKLDNLRTILNQTELSVKKPNWHVHR